jgi:hypothetical protein
LDLLKPRLATSGTRRREGKKRKEGTTGPVRENLKPAVNNKAGSERRNE